MLLLWALALALWVPSHTRTTATAAVINITWGKSQTEGIETNINPGDVVNWVWADSKPHGVKSTDARFASSTIVAELGYNYSVQFWGTGTYPYECLVHSTMTGSIIVSTIAGDPTSSPTVFSTPAPDLTTAFAIPKVIKSNQELPADWTLRLEVRMTTVYINEYISFNTRTFCILGDCRLVGPTIQVRAGDVITLIIHNHLEDNQNSSTPLSSTGPNTTRLYMHGVHTDNRLAFEEVPPGVQSEEYQIEIPLDHATGVHWYTSDTPGAAALHAMNGLVGAIYVQPQRIDNVPFAIQNAVSYIMVVTKLVVVQETEINGGGVTQGCSMNTTCDSTVQSPLCTGTEEHSYFNPYRLYTLEELNTEAGSDVNIDMDFNGTIPEDLTLINGQLLPTVQITNKNPFIFKIINAGTGGSLHITLPTSATRCEGAVIAVDGVYLQARWERTMFKIAPGSRVDLELFCDVTGIYTIYESGKEFVHLKVSQSSSNRPPVKDYQLFNIRRPMYLDDLRVQNYTTIDRYFTIDMSLHGANTCDYQMGYGLNCLNETVVYDEVETYPQYDYDCTYAQWNGSQGTAPFDYVLSNRFVTFVDAYNQWTIYGDRTAFQTFSMRGNHFQIMSMSSNETENDWFQVGQYRDTLPLVEDSVVIRFISADFEGEHTIQSNFMHHKERGAKDSFLVVNYSTFQSLTEFPTMAPTDTPNDGIIQVLSFQMAVAFGIVIVLATISIAVYLTYFTESRNTVFPDKVL